MKNFNVGETVIWTSRFAGETEAEYRGKQFGMDGYEACLIVRPADSCPYQIMVPIGEIRTK